MEGLSSTPWREGRLHTLFGILLEGRLVFSSVLKKCTLLKSLHNRLGFSYVEYTYCSMHGKSPFYEDAVWASPSQTKPCGDPREM